MFASIAALIITSGAAPFPSLEAPPPPPQPSTRISTIEPEEWARICKPWDNWDKPAPPFRVHGDTYYIGTCGISVLLVRTGDGFVLLDTGTENGAIEAMRNINSMNLLYRGIGLILYSHEHFDHVGGLSSVQSMTKAPVVAVPNATTVFLTGKDNPNDPQAGMHAPMKPAKNVIEISADAPVHFGGIQFIPISTPGHSPGALTWQWESCQMKVGGEVCKTIVYADSLSPISRDGYKFSDHTEYLARYRAGIERLRGLKCDILLTPHPSHSRMVKRAATGTLEGGMSCAEYADSKTRALDDRLAKEEAE